MQSLPKRIQGLGMNHKFEFYYSRSVWFLNSRHDDDVVDVNFGRPV